MTGIEKAIKPMRSRIKLQRTVEWGAIGVCVGMIGVLLLRAASFMWPFASVWKWSAALMAGVPVFCMLVSHLWPVSAMDAARKVDGSGLQARAQTALMLKDSDTPMADLQRQDTLKQLEKVHPGRVFPLKIPKLALIGMAVCLAVFGLSYLIPNPQESVLKARAEFQTKMAEQAKLVDDGAVKLNADDVQTPELRKVLGDLSMALRKAEEPRMALSAVDDAERRIGNMQTAARKDALNALQKSGQSDLADALKAGDTEKAEQLLSQQNQSNAANALAAAANSALDAATAQALNAAAQAMASGNLDQALGQLSAAANGASAVTVQAVALSNMVRMAAANAGAAQASLMAALGNNQGQGGKGQGGAGLGLGVGMGSGSGAGSGSSNEDGGYRQSSGRASITGQQQGQTKIEDYEAIYDPKLLNREGDTVTTKGKVGEGEISEVTAGTGLGSVDGSVPYNRVLAEYGDTAVQAAQNAALPSYAQKWVQDYFGALED